LTTFGTKLRELRNAAGLTQEELASKAGLTSKAVSALERAERKRPYPHTVRSLARALGLSNDERASLFAAVPSRGVQARGAEALSPAAGVRAKRHPAPPAGEPPVARTSLVGRERELSDIEEFLGGGVRLLTLTGTGGVGKSRLALEAARRLDRLFADGVAFVGLASLNDASLIIPTIAQALGLRETEGKSARQALHSYFKEKRFLLVLDNLEHLLEAVPEVVDLLEGCAKLAVLATSRAPLRVRGEQGYPVEPLAVPDPARTHLLEEIRGAAAVELFVERARAVAPSFELSQSNSAAVAAICCRLDGLPLALELAAARVRFLDPTALLARLDQALRAGGARDLPERQRTMRATLDWSHELLHVAEREFFGRLSVFAGGWTLEAAEAVGTEAADPLVLLGNLVEQSLVVSEWGADGSVRYKMLEPVRQYAQEKLEQSGEREQVRHLHAAFYLALAEEAEKELAGPYQGEWFDQLEAEHDNLRAALRWSLEEGAVEHRGPTLNRARQGSERRRCARLSARRHELGTRAVRAEHRDGTRPRGYGHRQQGHVQPRSLHAGGQRIHAGQGPVRAVPDHGQGIR
jgi:predicted ATPase/transcriptional regulator with XRE-family HTH domain